MTKKSFTFSQDFVAEDDSSEESEDEQPKTRPVSTLRKQKQEFKELKRQKNETSEYQEMLKEKKKYKNFKSARLIVRNLSFKSNEQLVKDRFSEFGEVAEVKLLRRGDKLVGCGFVQFHSKASAAKAIAKLSGKEFLGRPIVVDWALPKDKFETVIKKEVKVKEEPIEIKEEPEDDENGEVKDEDSASDGDEDDEKSSEEEDEPKKVSDEDDASEQDSDDGSESEGDEDEDDESEEDVKPDTKKLQKSFEGTKSKKYNFKYDPNDVDDGRTVFLKNVPFSVRDDDLLKAAEDVGPVVYAVVCIDPLTEHSKGTAFVKFEDKSVVNDLIEGRTKLVLKGVKADVLLAIKKDKVGSLKDKKVPKDNRNLYLLREGIILAGSPASVGVSEGDMAKRLQLEHWKTQTLKNLNKFVSTNRLVVHNIPPFYDDNRLKEVFKKYSPKGSFITEARIIRNLNDVDEKGVGKSKGFGFVTFTQHEHALEALRKINNNPHIFIDTKRPIVGFSIENRAALRLKEKRKMKSQNPPKKPTDEDKPKDSKDQQSKKRKIYQVSDENLPEFCGYTSKPGAKKIRSFKELKTQAALHHKAVVDKKREKKMKMKFGRKWKNQKKTKKF